MSDEDVNDPCNMNNNVCITFLEKMWPIYKKKVDANLAAAIPCGEDKKKYIDMKTRSMQF